MANVQGALSQLGTVGAQQQTGMLKALGPEFEQKLGALLRGEVDINQAALNQQQAAIGGQTQADVAQMRQRMAQQGMGGFTGAEAIASAREATGAGQLGAAAVEQQQIANQQALANLGFLNEALFGQSLDAGGMALGAEQAAKDRAAANKQAMIGAVGSIIGGFCWLARAVFGVEDQKWLDARAWITCDAPDWLYDWYGRNGQKWASRAERSWLLRAALRPIFEVIAWLGRR